MVIWCECGGHRDIREGSLVSDGCEVESVVQGKFVSESCAGGVALATRVNRNATRHWPQHANRTENH